MSTESSQSREAEQLAATKQQVRNMVAEIAELAKSDVEPAVFYEALLARAVTALVARGGAVWLLDDNGQLTLQYQTNLQVSGLGDDQEGQIRHHRLLLKALHEQSGMLVPPHSGDEEDGAANTTEWLLVLGALGCDRQGKRQPLGVIEIFQRPGGGPATQRGYLRFLLQLCELAGNYLATQQLRDLEERQTLWGLLERFTLSVHGSLHPIETAYTIVNEGRRLIECDRVSLAIRRGGNYRIEAVSHQATIERRSNVVVLLSRLATRVVATGEPMWYSGNTEDMPPQIEDAIHEYVDESQSKVVGVLPLFKPTKSDKEDKEEPGDPSDDIVGALIVEQFGEGVLQDRMLQRVEVVKDHASSAIANALEHNNLFLLPVWRTLGKLTWIIRARTLPKTIAAAVAVVLLILVLTFFPIDFNIEASGQLQPSERLPVFVVQGGHVEEILPGIEHGATVRKGQPLLQLKDLALDSKISENTGLLNETNVSLIAINQELTSNQDILSEAERQQKRSDRLTLLERKIRYENQLKLLHEQHDQLTIRSPIDGVILTWDLRKELAGQTLQPGQVVMSIADSSKEWELELHVPGNDMGYIAQREKELADQKPPETIRATYIVATAPEQSYQGNVKDIQNTVEIHDEEEGNTTLVLVDVDRKTIDENQIRPGQTATAKLDCGTRSVGFVLFRKPIAWIQKHILFRL